MNQLVTIISLILFLICISSEAKQVKTYPAVYDVGYGIACDNTGDKNNSLLLKILNLLNKNVATSVFVSGSSFICGNRIYDLNYFHIPGARFKAYMEFNNNEILITPLVGEFEIAGVIYTPNECNNKQIRLMPNETMIINKRRMYFYTVQEGVKI